MRENMRYAHFCKICEICCDRMIAINRYPYLTGFNPRRIKATQRMNYKAVDLAVYAKSSSSRDRQIQATKHQYGIVKQ